MNIRRIIMTPIMMILTPQSQMEKIINTISMETVPEVIMEESTKSYT